MSPVEFMNISLSLKRVDPTDEHPYRRYIPEVHELPSAYLHPQEKPGFYELVEEFSLQQCLSRLPTLSEHLELLSLINTAISP